MFSDCNRIKLKRSNRGMFRISPNNWKIKQDTCKLPFLQRTKKETLENIFYEVT